jgi:hypothetical protein
MEIPSPWVLLRSADAPKPGDEINNKSWVHECNKNVAWESETNERKLNDVAAEPGLNDDRTTFGMVCGWFMVH